MNSFYRSTAAVAAMALSSARSRNRVEAGLPPLSRRSDDRVRPAAPHQARPCRSALALTSKKPVARRLPISIGCTYGSASVCS